MVGRDRFGATGGVRVVQAARSFEIARAVGRADPRHVAHFDVAHAGDGVGDALHDVADRELAGKGGEVNDVVVVRQANAVGGDERNAGSGGHLEHVDAPIRQGLVVKVIQAGHEIHGGGGFVAQVEHDAQIDGLAAFGNMDGGRGRRVAVTHHHLNGLQQVPVGLGGVEVVHGPLGCPEIRGAQPGGEGPVVVDGQDGGVGRRVDGEVSSVAGLGRQLEIGADLSAHGQQALVGALKVKVLRTCQIELAGGEFHRSDGSEAKRGLEHVVDRRAFISSIGGVVGGASGRDALVRERVDIIGGNARHGAEARGESVLDGVVDFGFQRVAHGGA